MKITLVKAYKLIESIDLTLSDKKLKINLNQQ